MDFFIDDTDDSIMEYVTFVNFTIFEREYLKSVHYNDPFLKGIGCISLQSPEFEKTKC